MVENSIEKLLAWAVNQLNIEPVNTDSPMLDARILLAHCLSKSTTYLMTWPEKNVSDQAASEFTKLVSLRREGRPVAHLVGYKDFWTVSLEVNPHTLIPRPETELLVEKTLQLALSHKAKVLDLGTGTGAIAIALATEQPHWQLIGVDRIEQAIALATRNAKRNHVSNASFILSDWFDSIGEGEFDVIVSNPPYVESVSPYLSQGDVRYEPLSALIAGEDGMSDIERIIPASLKHLVPGGWLLIEHGYNQADLVEKCFRQHGFVNVELVRDLNQLPRITLAQKPNNSSLINH